MVRTSSCPQTSDLESLSKGSLPSGEMQGLLEHLETCAYCLAAIQKLSPHDTLVELVARAHTVSEPHDEVLTRLMQRLKGLVRAPAANAVLAISCTSCSHKLKVKADLAGKKIKCPHCGQPTRVPAPDPDRDRTVPPLSAQAKEDRTLPPSDQPSLPSDGQTVGEHPANDEAWDFLAPAQQPDEIGRLGTYRVLKVLGQGGMGIVFRAEDPQLERPIALKAMLPSLAASPSAKKRFLREARAAAAIKHDHVVTIYQVGEDRGAPFLAMEFLEGEPLDVRLQRENTLPLAEVLRIGREMADGLAAAHERGMIHRDVKPANVWLEGKRGRVKILDFGLARSMADQTNLTQAGAIVGTPAFMAPEQATGTEVDHRADLFSLGCVLYRMTTGQLPFKGNDTLSILASLALDTPRPAQELAPDLPPALGRLIERLLAKDPAERLATAREVADSLAAIERAIAQGEPMPATAGTGAPRRRWLVAAAVLGGFAALAAVASVIVIRGDDSKGEFVVETEDDQVMVALNKDGGVRLLDRKSNKEYLIQARQSQHLPVGDYELVVNDVAAGLEFSARTFSVKRDGKETLKVSFRKAGGATADGTAPPGQSPFDAFKRENVPAEEFLDAGNGDPARVPRGLVGVIGSSRLKHWVSPAKVAFSADGSRLITLGAMGGADKWNQVRVWDAQTGRLISIVDVKYVGHALSRDGSRTAAGAGLNSVTIWDTATGKEVCKTAPHGAGTQNAAFTADAKWLATTSYDKTAKICDAATGKEIFSLRHTQPVFSVAFSPDGKRLATSADPGNDVKGPSEVKVWDTATGKEVQSLTGAIGLVLVLAFSPDSRSLIGYDRSGVMRTWDVEAGGKPRDWPGRFAGSSNILFLPDGKRLLVGGHVYDFATGKQGGILVNPHPGFNVGGLALSPDGKRLASAGTDRRVVVADLATGETLLTPGEPTEALRCLALSPDGRRLFTSGLDQTLRTWDTATGKELVSHRKANCGIYFDVALSEDGKRLARIDVKDERPRITTSDAATGEDILTFGQTQLVYVRQLASNPSGTRLVSIEHESQGGGRVQVWDAIKGEVLFPLKGHSGAVYWAAFSPDGKHLVTVGADETIRTWNCDTGKEITSFKHKLGHDDGRSQIVFSPDSKQLALRGPDAEVHVLDAATGTLLKKLADPGVGRALALAFHPEGKWLATTTDQGQVVLWDLVTPRNPRVISLPGVACCLAYAPDGRHLLTGNDNGTIYVLRLAEK